MFGWAQLAIVRPGDIVVMAFAFATYARTLWDPLDGTVFPYMQQVYAASATIALTAINVWGVRQGKWTQNFLTSAKALGLLLVVGAAFLGGGREAPAVAEEVSGLPFSLALIFVLFVFGGWNEMAYVAAEVKDARRNIVRALVIGTVTVTGLYLLVNLAFVHTLGLEGMKTSGAVATDTVARVFPTVGAALISGLICISALGAVNGLIFTGARISYAVGQDHRLFYALGRWHPKLETPATALAVQGAVAVILIVVLGSFVEAVLYTAAAVYSFYAASTVAVLVLRRKEPHVERPFRVPGYPITPLIFAGVCLFLIHSAVTYKPVIAVAAGVLLLAGVGLWWMTSRKPRL
jgi:amino acid transporter